MRGRVLVRYNVDLECAGGCCYFLLEDGCTIRVVLSEASSERHTVELPVYFRKPRPGALHLKPLDAELDGWLVEGSNVHKSLARMELQLCGTPAHVSKQFLEL